MSSRPARKRKRLAAHVRWEDASFWGIDARAFAPPSFELLPRPPAIQAKIDELNAVIDEQHRQLGAMRIAVPHEGYRSSGNAAFPTPGSLREAVAAEPMQLFERGPAIGLDELRASGAISQAFYDELRALPKAPSPPATLVIRSVDRERGIVTFEAAP